MKKILFLGITVFFVGSVCAMKEQLNIDELCEELYKQKSYQEVVELLQKNNLNEDQQNQLLSRVIRGGKASVLAICLDEGLDLDQEQAWGIIFAPKLFENIHKEYSNKIMLAASRGTKYIMLTFLMGFFAPFTSFGSGMWCNSMPMLSLFGAMFTSYDNDKLVTENFEVEKNRIYSPIQDPLFFACGVGFHALFMFLARFMYSVSNVAMRFELVKKSSNAITKMSMYELGKEYAALVPMGFGAYGLYACFKKRLEISNKSQEMITKNTKVSNFLNKKD